jgi:hypothetical protein
VALGVQSKPGPFFPLGTVAIAVLKETSAYARIAMQQEFQTIRERIRSFRYLPDDWDSYGAGPLSETTIKSALALIDRLDLLDIVPEKVAATADDSIFISYSSRGMRREWEIFEDGENVLIEIDSCDNRRYRAVQCEEIRDFVQAE